MSATQTSIQQVHPPRSPQEILPTMYDLKSEDLEEPGLPDEYHLWQAQLCSATFAPPTHPPERVLVASDLNLYYDPKHTGWYKRPDWYAVVGVDRLYEGREPRLSYVFWQEGVRPMVAVELLSPSTRNEDLGETQRGGQPPTKWEVYEKILGIPYYIVFDRYQDELQVFELTGGSYQPLTVTGSRVWLPALELGIGLWQGEYCGLERQWLRWYDEQGCWIPTSTEAPINRLLDMGLSVEQVAEALGLSVERVNEWRSSFSGIQQGLDDLNSGLARPLETFKQEMQQQHGISSSED